MAEDNGPRIIPDDSEAQIRERKPPKTLFADTKAKAYLALMGLLLILGFYATCHSPKPTMQSTKAPQPMAPQLPPPDSVGASESDLNRQLEDARRQAEIAEQRRNAAVAQMKANGLTDQQIAAITAGHDVNLQPQGEATTQEKTEAQKLEDDRRQREYRSLFASSVPVVQAKQQTPPDAHQESDSAESQVAPSAQHPDTTEDSSTQPKKAAYDFDRSDGPTHRLTEGTIIEGALSNQLSGDFTGPVLVQVTTNVYDRSLQHLLIPQGAKFIGESSQVSGFGQQRLAVKFHRIDMPDGYSVSLDQFQGLSQTGETGLSGKVNSHYASIFGASLAIGAIGGLAQIGNGGYGNGGYSPMTGFQNGVSQSMAQSADRVLDRFLNRLPSVTIKAGTRVKVFLSGDLLLPEYENHRMDKEF